MQEGAYAYLTEPDVKEKDIVDINVVSTVLFLVMASVFLILLHYSKERERERLHASKQGTTHKQRIVTQCNKQNMKIATVPNK